MIYEKTKRICALGFDSDVLLLLAAELPQASIDSTPGGIINCDLLVIDHDVKGADALIRWVRAAPRRTPVMLCTALRPQAVPQVEGVMFAPLDSALLIAHCRALLHIFPESDRHMMAVHAWPGTSSSLKTSY